MDKMQATSVFDLQEFWFWKTNEFKMISTYISLNL